MNIFKIVLVILGIGAAVGVGSVLMKSKNTLNPVVIPVNPVVNPVNNVSSQFGKDIKLKINGTSTFPDGLIIKLKEINDSRCPKDFNCIWQGELSGKFFISGGKLTNPQDITLGTVKSESVKADGYTFTLKGATTDSMTIVVDYKTPVIFIKSCYVGGCSNQICSDKKDIVSTCEWQEKYICYQKATCERQDNGQCGWTETPELKYCLQNKMTD